MMFFKNKTFFFKDRRYIVVETLEKFEYLVEQTSFLLNKEFCRF